VDAGAHIGAMRAQSVGRKNGGGSGLCIEHGVLGYMVLHFRAPID
jgi:hypothetical protein